MELTLGSRIRSAWNAFTNRDPTPNHAFSEVTSYYRPDKIRLTRGVEKTIATSIYNRISLDVSATVFKHCICDMDGNYMMDCDSKLNDCLNLRANIDQTSRSLIQDAVLTMFDEGHVVFVPVKTTADPRVTESYDIKELRIGTVVEWSPMKVKVRVYNDITGRREEIWLDKSFVGIVENPFYSIVNEPNSLMQRLIRKLSLLDVTDEQTASGKLDMIIQLPYIIKTDARREQAERRRKDIEDQLKSSKYGIAYTDGTEKITQLNRSVENQLLNQVKYLTEQVFAQFGMGQKILDGTASEEEKINYYNTTIEPIVSAIANELKTKFLSSNAITRGQSIMAFRDQFKLATLKDVVQAADTLTRNEIASSNEIRQKLGMKPSGDPRADQLRNSNMPQSYEEQPEEGYEDNSVEDMNEA